MGDREAFGGESMNGAGADDRAVELQIARALQVEEDGEDRHAVDRNGAGFQEEIAAAVQMITVRGR